MANSAASDKARPDEIAGLDIVTDQIHDIGLEDKEEPGGELGAADPTATTKSNAEDSAASNTNLKENSQSSIRSNCISTGGAYANLLVAQLEQANKKSYEGFCSWEKSSGHWSPVYSWEKHETKLLLIINNQTFDVYGQKLQARPYSSNDVESLTECFKGLGFDVEPVALNRTAQEMKEDLTRVSARKHIGCLAIAIMTHGSKGEELYGKDDTVKVKSLLERLKCTNLRETPKLIIIQACRGKDKIVFDPNCDDTPAVQESLGFPAPLEADMLIVHSTLPDHLSHYRNEGSWFIQSLCTCLKWFGREMDIMEILQRVAFLMSSIDIWAITGDATNLNLTLEASKQIPSVVSQLRKKLYLTDEAAVFSKSSIDKSTNT